MTQITLFIDDEIESKLDELRELTCVVDSVEVIRRALAVYDHLINHQVDEWEILLRRGKDEKVLVLI